MPSSLGDSFKDCHSDLELANDSDVPLPDIWRKLHPNFWCSMSELMCDLTTAILHNNEWDSTKLFGQNQHFVLPPRQLDESILISEGRDLIVDIDTDPRSTNDININNLILLMVEIEGMDNLV